MQFGFPQMKPPTHQVQYENLGLPVMTFGFLFPVETFQLSLSVCLSAGLYYSLCFLNMQGTRFFTQIKDLFMKLL
jgi:hypothetical protein